MRLGRIFARHGCDRVVHGYDKAWEPLFNSIRDAQLNILEVGILRGAGILSWLDYFPNATITGMDTFERVALNRVEVIKHDRVRYIQGDSRFADPEGLFDLIFDDGNHHASHQRDTMINLRQHVRDQGRYFIEDVRLDDIGFALLNASLPENAIHHDLRKGRKADSYLIEIPS